MFGEYKDTAIKEETYSSEAEVHEGPHVTSDRIVVCLCEETTSKWRYKAGERVDEAIRIVHLIVDRVIKLRVLPFDNVQITLKSLKHFRDNWDEDEVLKDAHKWESCNNQCKSCWLIQFGESKYLRWSEEETGESVANHGNYKLKLLRE